MGQYNKDIFRDRFAETLSHLSIPCLCLALLGGCRTAMLKKSSSQAASKSSSDAPETKEAEPITEDDPSGVYFGAVEQSRQFVHDMNFYHSHVEASFKLTLSSEGQAYACRSHRFYEHQGGPSPFESAFFEQVGYSGRWIQASDGWLEVTLEPDDTICKRELSYDNPDIWSLRCKKMKPKEVALLPEPALVCERTNSDGKTIGEDLVYLVPGVHAGHRLVLGKGKGLLVEWKTGCGSVVACYDFLNGEEEVHITAITEPDPTSDGALQPGSDP